MKQLLFTTLFLAGIFSATAQTGTLEFFADFSNGVSSPGGKFNQNKFGLVCTDSGMLVRKAPGRSGNSLRSFLYSTCSTCTFSTRDESSYRETDSSVQNSFIGWDIYFEDFEYDTRTMLFHQFFTPAYPCFFTRIIPFAGVNWLQLVRQVDTTQTGGTFGGTLTGNQFRSLDNLIPLPNNTWLRIDFDFFWASDYTGYIKVYLNDVLAMTLPGANLKKQYDPLHPSYPDCRIGQYWADAHITPLPEKLRKTYYTNFTIGRRTNMTFEQYMAKHTLLANEVPPTPAVPKRMRLKKRQ